MAKKKSSPYGKSYYKQYEAGFVSENRKDHQRILELARFSLEDKVLEIGCGYGVLLKKIISRKKIGIEANRYAVNVCRKRGLNVIFDTKVEKKINFKSNTFDFVIMNEVIEHLQNPEAVVREVNRVLCSGGKFIITTTARNLLNRSVDPTHFSEMSISELRCLLEKNYFEILTCEVSGIHVFNFLLNNFVFKVGRMIRKNVKPSRSLVDVVQGGFDKTFLGKLLSTFRSNFLCWGTTQLVIAKKVNREGL